MCVSEGWFLDCLILSALVSVDQPTTYPTLIMSARQSTSSAAHLPITPTVPQAVHALAAPAPSLVDSQLPNYLLPAALDLLRSSATHVVKQRRNEEDDLRAQGLLPPLDKGKAKAMASAEDEDRALIEAELAKRVERLGLMVGGYIAEKSVYSILDLRRQAYTQTHTRTRTARLAIGYHQIHLQGSVLIRLFQAD